jgi:hypothetical protein
MAGGPSRPDRSPDLKDGRIAGPAYSVGWEAEPATP